jgi:hypothetical protein
MCVLILLMYVSVYHYVCVLILLICVRVPLYVSLYYCMCVLIQMEEQRALHAAHEALKEQLDREHRHQKKKAYHTASLSACVSYDLK